jgi:hypothetical protein
LKNYFMTKKRGSAAWAFFTQLSTLNGRLLDRTRTRKNLAGIANRGIHLFSARGLGWNPARHSAGGLAWNLDASSERSGWNPTPSIRRIAAQWRSELPPLHPKIV